MNTPIYFYSDVAREEMFNIVKDLPEAVEVYLVGGAVRNALIQTFHQETWRQRDYDQIVTKGADEYFSYLEARGFRNSSHDRPMQRIMAKALSEDAPEISYEENLVFDMHVVEGTTAADNLRNETGLLINGVAISLRDIFRDDWEACLVTLPGALDSIQQRQVRVNEYGYDKQPSNIFACLRFIGAGFSAPPQEEVRKLLLELLKLDHEKYQKNLTKLSDYVGGDDHARELGRRVIDQDVDLFNEEVTKSWISARFVY